MKLVNALIAGVLSQGLVAAVQAEIYESTDAAGNKVFTDKESPGAEILELNQSNIADAVTSSDTADAAMSDAAASAGAKAEAAVPQSSASPTSASPIAPGYDIAPINESDDVDEGREEVLEALPPHTTESGDQINEVEDAQPRREVGDNFR